MMEIKRRDFLKILGFASAAAAGCNPREATRKLVPMVIPAEEIIPGVANWYATVCRECPAGCGMLAKVREGRAIKVEGNPSHPINAGSLCARGQASLQGLYNPDRIRQPLRRDASGNFHPISWEEGEKFLAERLSAIRFLGKASRIAFLTHRVTGSLERLIGEWLQALGSKRWLFYEAFAYEPLTEANRICFSQDSIPEYRVDEAEFLLSFGADFLETWISPVEFARAFSNMRKPRNGKMGHFVYVGPRLSLTAANADEWIAPKPGTELFLALGMVHLILRERIRVNLPSSEAEQLWKIVEPYDSEKVAELTDMSAGKVRNLARAFAQARTRLALGGGITTSGSNATVTAVAINLLNYVAGNVGKTIRFDSKTNGRKMASLSSMVTLTDQMKRGDVEILLLHGVNPTFTLPVASGFTEALKRVPLIVSFSSFMDETTERAHLILPDHTPIESWGDYSPREGIYGLMQPVMQPIFQTKAVGDVLLSVAKQVDESMAKRLGQEKFYDYLRDRWREIHRRVAPNTGFESFWQEALKKGGVFKESAGQAPRLDSQVVNFKFPIEESRFEGDEASPVLIPYPSPYFFDGRGANKPWLQELPDPLTTIVWDSWVEIHPETAQKLKISNGDLLTLESPNGKIQAPAYLYAGVRRDVAALPIGQGHSSYGRYATGRGANPIDLLSPVPEVPSGGMMWSSTRVKITKTGKRQPLVMTAGSDRQHGRGIAQAIPLAALSAKQEVKGEEKKVPQIYPSHNHPKHRWGMAIDLNACVGCNACVTACYAENNLPVVGKELVAKSREMSWIRIERYFEGDAENPKPVFLPMLCQQCGYAPCESVCPVYATYHTSEGLNAQVYPRCIGVRYCENNCPYKVRRFNWFTYTWPEPLNLQLNPDVTVREVGVTEKCTFCVQRIRAAKDRAKDEGREVRDGEIVPACAQSCPAEAIVFGDLKDPESKVAKLSRESRRYRVLEHLNTEPAITYLKKVKRE
jgi:molybdopterin-containing oxidoreductase family iron-sulfur binding subunit